MDAETLYCGLLHNTCNTKHSEHLLRDDLVHHISGVHVDGADGHDFLPVSGRQLPDQHGDECVQLVHLLLIIVLHGVLVSLLQPGEGHAHISGPPDLSAGQRHLQEHIS